MRTFQVNTPKNSVKIECFYNSIGKDEIKVDKQVFCDMCLKGCKNYGKKYSCPPCSPDFNQLAENYEGLFVLLFKCDLNQINSTEYNKVRIANSMMKSRIDKLMRALEGKSGGKFLSTGSCRLCKKCNLQSKLPCKHPKEMRFSLEATGVDCDFLSKKLFNLPLLWFRDGNAPDYTCCVTGLLCNSKDTPQIQREAENLLSNLFDISL